MRIARLHLEGFKRFHTLDLTFDQSLTIIVGDNETGKSTILDALALVLTGRYQGHLIQYAIDPYLFNSHQVAEYFAKSQEGETVRPPRILLEAYFEPDRDDPSLAMLKGTNNSRSEDCPGLSLAIRPNADYLDALKEYASDRASPEVLPVEFFVVDWRAFSDSVVTSRNVPLRTKVIDNSLPRAVRGPTRYLADVVSDVLTDEQRRDLSLAYKRLRYGFSQEAGIQSINQHLRNAAAPATAKTLTVQVDMTARDSWESAIVPHLDDLPFDCAGKGQQCQVQLRLAIAGADPSHVLLIEEPENHLSHSNLNVLMDTVARASANRQIIISTHSAFVLNKLGIHSLRLLSSQGRVAALTDLSDDTRDYFMKLPGYDTLRLILARSAILVEGPSDELIVQRAYRNHHGRLPLEDGVDVISVGSLAFKRFLEIAVRLHTPVRLVTDNDGDVQHLLSQYSEYVAGAHPDIRVFFDTDETRTTLEPQLLKYNSVSTMNAILQTVFEQESDLLKYMHRHKTDSALKLFYTNAQWVVPGYISDAVAAQ